MTESKIRSFDIDKILKIETFILWKNPIISLNTILATYFLYPLINKDNFTIVILVILVLSIILSLLMIKTILNIKENNKRKVIHQLLKEAISNNNYLYLNYLLIDPKFNNVRSIFEELVNEFKLDLEKIAYNKRSYIKSLVN